MPALKPVPAVARVTVQGTANSQPIVNVFHLKWTGGNIPAGSILYMAQLVATQFQNQFLPWLNTVYTAGSCRAVDLSLAAGEEATVPMTGTGIGSGGHVPQSAACCITWKIMRHYRGGHPRTYLGPISDSAIQNNTTLAAGFLASILPGATSFRNGINAGTTGGETIKLVCVHRYADGVELLVPQTSDIIGESVDNRIDSMRRRLGRDR